MVLKHDIKSTVGENLNGWHNLRSRRKLNALDILGSISSCFGSPRSLSHTHSWEEDKQLDSQNGWKSSLEIPLSEIISFILTTWYALKVGFPFEFCQTESSENVLSTFW